MLAHRSWKTLALVASGALSLHNWVILKIGRKLFTTLVACVSDSSGNSVVVTIYLRNRNRTCARKIAASDSSAVSLLDHRIASGQHYDNISRHIRS